MRLLRRTAKSISGTIGRSHPLINALRPAYDRLLDWSSNGQGIMQTINGREQFLIDPHQRVHFPEIYDPAVCSYLRQRVKPGDVCLNIGAHVGLYALCLANWSAPGGRVYAFEPNPLTRELLSKHVALNNASERIKVVAQAISDSPGETTFFATGLEGFSRLGQPNPQATHAGLRPITVEVTSIDDFCAEQGIVPDWIIMDIEGYEIKALAGARKTIKTMSGRLGIMVEMHPNVWPLTGTSRAHLESLLAELSLKPVMMSGQSDPLSEYGIVRLEYV